MALKFNEIFKQLEERLKNLKTLLKSLDKDITGQGIKGYETGVRGLIDAQKAAEKVQKDLNEARKKGIKVNKEAIKEADKLAALNKERVNQLRREQREEAKLTVSKEKIQELRRKEIKSDRELVDLNRRLINVRASLTKNTKANRIEYKKLTKEIVRNEKVIRKSDKSIGRSQRNVGNYGSALKGLGSQLGITFGALGLVRVFKNMAKIFKTFEKDAKRLQAIIGTGINIEGLTKQAKDLGSSSVFTANQIISLQTELAKLGFTVSEILSSTTGIQALAAATGIDLAEAATVAGSALKIFGLDASESARVADVLAKSTSLSALDMQKLATALPTVGTTARIAGKSIERTTALLGVLSDRGLDASTSATSLRNIFLELSKQGITMEEALDRINGATDKNNESLKIFGKRSAAAGVIIAENTGSINELEQALINADGAAQDMADTMLDNLAGDITLAKSAWEGLVLSVEDGEGPISGAFRRLVTEGTKLLNFFTELNAGRSNAEAVWLSDEGTKKVLKDYSKFLDTLEQLATDSNRKISTGAGFDDVRDRTEREKRLELIKSYSEQFKLTLKEYRRLTIAEGKSYQGTIEQRLKLQIIQERINSLRGEEVEEVEEELELEKEINEVLKERKKIIKPDVPKELGLIEEIFSTGVRGGDSESTLNGEGSILGGAFARGIQKGALAVFSGGEIEGESGGKGGGIGSFISRLFGFGDPSKDEKALTESLVRLYSEAMNFMSELTQNQLQEIQDLLQLQDEAIAKTMDLLETEENRIKKLDEAGQGFSTKEKERLEQKLRNEQSARERTLKEERELKKKQQRLSAIQAGIDIASAVLSIWSQKGGNFYVKLAQSIIFGAIGGLQLAAIKSAKFATGTDSVPLNGAKPGIDTVHAQLTAGEGVIQEPINKKIPYHKGFKRSMMPAAAEMYLNGMRGNSVYVNDNEIGNGYLKGIEKNTRNDFIYDSMGKLKIKKVGKNNFYYN